MSLNLITILYASKMLSNDLIQKFKIIYKNQFNEELNDFEASKKGEDLIHLLKSICDRGQEP